MTNNTKTEGKTSTLSEGVTETPKNVKAVNVRKVKNGFDVLYENGMTLRFDLEYMDRTEADFDGEVSQ